MKRIESHSVTRFQKLFGSEPPRHLRLKPEPQNEHALAEGARGRPHACHFYLASFSHCSWPLLAAFLQALKRQVLEADIPESSRIIQLFLFAKNVSNYIGRKTATEDTAVFKELKQKGRFNAVTVI